jgi:predicted acetylornithine/succinylornithine family transaminase
MSTASSSPSDPTAAPTSPGWPERAKRVLMNNYGERTILLQRGEGVRVWDFEGREYLDFLSGIAVCSLGHCPPRVVAALREQAGKLLHVSNFFLIEPQIRLAELLCGASGLDRCLIVNTGTEAMEGAIKLARMYANKKYGLAKRPTMLACTHSFHGRTYGALSLTHSAKCRTNFDPFLPEARFVEYNDAADLRAKMDDTVCAIVFETVQGEGGIRPVSREFFATARELADRHDACLILDEVQCGFSRTGNYFAWQGYEGLRPDVMTLAKAMGGGAVVGAIVAQGKWGEVFEPGNHGTTFGGNPLACAAALAASEELLTPAMLERVKTTGTHLRDRLEGLAARHSVIKEVRGLGLMLGVELKEAGAEVYKACLRRGLIINCTALTVLRIVPPLIVTAAECDRAVAILDEALTEVFGGK